MKNLTIAALLVGNFLSASVMAEWSPLDQNEYRGLLYTTHALDVPEDESSTGLVIHESVSGKLSMLIAYETSGCTEYEDPNTLEIYLETFYLSGQPVKMYTQCYEEGTGLKIPANERSKEFMINECRTRDIVRYNSYENGFRETFDCRGFAQAWNAALGMIK